MPVVKAPEPLFEAAREYGFFQLLRLLRLSFEDEQAFRQAVRVRPSLGLGFPECDIESVERDADGHIWIEANFFGLYGVSSPLPTFYSEDLLDERRNGGRVMRDFLDILHAELYPLLFQAWEKYRSWLVICERREQRRLQQFYALLGLADVAPAFAEDRRLLLPYAGLFNQYPRSALSLQVLVQGVVGVGVVTVRSCIERRIPVTGAARFLLGQQACGLGMDSLLGGSVMDRTSTLAIRLGSLSAVDFHGLLPGTPLHQRLARVVGLYLQGPLDCRLQLGLMADEQPAASLGTGWQQLGLNTWLGERSVYADIDLDLRPGPSTEIHP